jgi:hypothetical protein
LIAENAKLERGAWLAVLLFPILLNALGLFGIVKADPVFRQSNLETGVVPGPVAGLPRIDPNTGVTFQSLGKRSTDLMLGGKLPWWNSDAGVGLPLAGEMQPAAFFPLTPLQELPNGQTIVDVVVQILAGVFTLLLLRRLGVGSVASVAGALLFEANGTFAWLGAGWCYPLPFLPMLLFGIESALGSTPKERVAGTLLIAAAIWLSITAAMIEIAYFDGLLGVAWAGLRLGQTPAASRPALLRRLAFGAVIGLLLATPLLVAFIDYLSVSYVGLHSGTGDPFLVIEALPQSILPYIWGPIFSVDNQTLNVLWGNVGGYTGAALAFLAVCALFGSYQRPLRFLLGAWTFVTYAATIGFPVFHQLVLLVPGLRYTAYYRYLDGTRELALALLVAFFIHDLATDGARKWVRYGAATASVIAVFLIGILESSSVLGSVSALPAFNGWFWGSIAWGLAALAAIWAIAFFVRPASVRAYALAGIVIAEAAANYVIPTLAFPRDAHLADGSVAFLRDHVGLNRVYALGPLSPNYGSYFDVAEIDHNQLPVAAAWISYVKAHLDPYADPVSFTGDYPAKGPNVPGRDEMLRANLAAFEDIGVKYVLSYHDTVPLESVVDVALAPPMPRGVPPIRLLDTRGGMRIRLDRMPAGRLTAVAIMQGNYDGSADGDLSLRVCSLGRCTTGRRPFSESLNNKLFQIPLATTLPVSGAPITIVARQTGAKSSDAVWLFASKPDGTERAAVNGKVLNGLAPMVRLLYGAPGTGQPRQVYHDDWVDIDELPAPAPYYSAPGCVLDAAERDAVKAHCAAPSTLTRRELNLPGWSATVNGTPTAVATTGEIFQSVVLGAGDSAVSFAFTPPHMAFGYAAFVLGLIGIASVLFTYRRRIAPAK